MLEICVASGNVLRFKRSSVEAVELLDGFDEPCLDLAKTFTARIFFKGGWSIMVDDTKARIKGVVDALAEF